LRDGHFWVPQRLDLRNVRRENRPERGVGMAGRGFIYVLILLHDLLISREAVTETVGPTLTLCPRISRTTERPVAKQAISFKLTH
jgi:hypothetical protein